MMMIHKAGVHADNKKRNAESSRYFLRNKQKSKVSFKLTNEMLEWNKGRAKRVALQKKVQKCRMLYNTFL